jgi:hypothetical protein
MEFAPPPLDMSMLSTCGKYHSKKLELKRALNRPPTIDEVATEMGIPVEKADRCENLINDIISKAKRNEQLMSDRNASMGNTPSSHPDHDPTNPLHFGGRKSRRHAKKSRRHGKKSRRHAKKSRRHGKSRR